VGGLGHYLEAENIATAGISLIREHTVRMRPPRALWVPFPLGRPFGAANDPAFQADVLRRLLATFERSAGPVLDDYERDAPEAVVDTDEAWSCPLPLPPLEPGLTEADRLAQALQSEALFLLPWYNQALKQRRRTQFGLSGLSIDDVPEMAEYVARLAAGEQVAPPKGMREPMPAALRSIVDDLKTIYLEAASAQPGASAPGHSELNRWLYHETRLGGALYDLRDRLAREAEAERSRLAPEAPRRPLPALIPNAFRDRPAVSGKT
jgi:hypothetical protein